MNRRRLVFSAAPLALLAACGVVSTSKTGSVTTVSLNLAKLSADVDAVSAGAAAVLALGATIPQVAAATPAVNAVVAVVKTDMAALASANPTGTLTFDQSSPPAAINSLLADAQSVLDALNGIVLTPAQSQKVQPFIALVGASVASVKAAVVSVSS